MPRHGWFGFLLVCLPALAFADPPAAPTPVENALAIQKAMVMARAYLRMEDPHKAVDVLEQNLAKANGSPAYLELLRDAYRDRVRELALKGQAAEAQRYLQRLAILDPSAANDPLLKAPTPGPKFVPQAPRTESADATPLPKFVPPATPTSAVRPPKIEVASSTPKPSAVRGMRQLPQDDPFDPSNQRVPTPSAERRENSLPSLLAAAHAEFERARYGEARTRYEQAVQLDRSAIEGVRDRLAYCMLDGVVQQLNGVAAPPFDALQQQVRGAMSLSPKLAPTGQWLLKEIESRGRTVQATSTPDAALDPPLNLQHYGKNPQGWLVAESTHFRIFHNQSRELAESVALVAERARAAMLRKWFAAESADWTPKCEVVLHATGADYARVTGQHASSPGHSRIDRHPTSLQITGRRIDLHVDVMGFLEAVLPHETTHVVLAGQFGSHDVPRWADEGTAVLTEPTERIDAHRRNLLRARKERTLFPLRDLMQMTNYPDGQRISAFYAQSVSLVDFLAHQRGPVAFSEFLRDALQSGYEPALRRHYGLSPSDLQAAWEMHAFAESNVAAGR